MPPSPWASGCTTPHNCPRDTTIDVTPGCYKVHYNIAAFSEAQENVAEPPADFPRVVKIDYGNDKIAYETLAIGYNDKPMQSETGDGGMFYWLNVEGMTVGYRLTVELIRDSPKHCPAHKTPPVAELFEHWKEQFRSMSWVALAYQGDGGGTLAQCASV
ncbi:hypothetical protein D6D03_04094 [Aureobasidium pullulans]|nr:hypothetical protein D6D03_04094 [Aureobasidium pullulans]